MIFSTDQLGNKLQINFPPKRIVSLVPSQTEFLFDIGLDEEIVGITRFCIHPANKLNARQKIGGTKNFDIEKIKALNPDLIIANKEENYQERIEELQKHFPVWISDIFTLNDSYAMMAELARITGRADRGEELINEIKNNFINYKPAIQKPVKTAAYFIWRKPYMVAATDTYIHHLLEIFGVKNVFDGLNRYPEIETETLAQLKADYIFLSSEPYRFNEKHFDEFRAFFPTSKVILVDGEMFSWYGSRLRLAPGYFEKLWEEL